MNERAVLVVLLVLLASQLTIVAAQVPSREGGQSQLEAAVLQVVAPAARLVLSTDRGLQDLRAGWRGRAVLEARLQQAEEQNRFLESELLRLRQVEERLQRASAALSYQPPTEGRLQLADVLYIDHGSMLRGLVLWAPAGDLRPNQAVLTDDGLVGRIVLVSGDYAKVQLITDQASAIGAMVQRSRRQGLVEGTAEGRLELAYIQLQSEIRIGDRVVTSGVDGVYPRGLEIGSVAKVQSESDLFHHIVVAPAVDLTTLDHVYILESSGVPEAIKESLPDGSAPAGAAAVGSAPAAPSSTPEGGAG
ncbi:MAG: rod shape-determining protein MreC [Acidobacteriota bacterium]